MKQFNVREETHKLGRLLSLQTQKSILDIVHEALELYQKSREGHAEEDDLVSRCLNEAASAITKRMRIVVPVMLDEMILEAVEKATIELRRLQEQVRAEQAKELEELLRETLPKAPDEDDLKEVTEEELYNMTTD